MRHAAIDAGADIIYGSHPHVLHKTEEYNGKYIYYSMGNWSFGGNTNPRDKDTFILQMQVFRAVDGTVSISEYSVIPANFSCDAYDYLNGVPDAFNNFYGEYMSQYSWAEYVNAQIANELSDY